MDKTAWFSLSHTYKAAPGWVWWPGDPASRRTKRPKRQNQKTHTCHGVSTIFVAPDTHKRQITDLLLAEGATIKAKETGNLAFLISDVAIPDGAGVWVASCRLPWRALFVTIVVSCCALLFSPSFACECVCLSGCPWDIWPCGVWCVFLVTLDVARPPHVRYLAGYVTQPRRIPKYTTISREAGHRVLGMVQKSIHAKRQPRTIF